MDNLILRNINVKGSIVEFSFEASGTLKQFFTTDKMFVKYDRDVSSVPLSILAIPFVGSVIALTWLTNSVLWVNEIDDTFYNAMKNLKVAFQELYPKYKFGGRFVAAYRNVNAVPKT